jgi:hypothetical protein
LQFAYKQMGTLLELSRLSIYAFSTFCLVNPLRNSHAISKHEVKSLLTYEKDISLFQDVMR